MIHAVSRAFGDFGMAWYLLYADLVPIKNQYADIVPIEFICNTHAKPGWHRPCIIQTPCQLKFWYARVVPIEFICKNHANQYGTFHHMQIPCQKNLLRNVQGRANFLAGGPYAKDMPNRSSMPTMPSSFRHTDCICKFNANSTRHESCMCRIYANQFGTKPAYTRSVPNPVGTKPA